VRPRIAMRPRDLATILLLLLPCGTSSWLPTPHRAPARPSAYGARTAVSPRCEESGSDQIDGLISELRASTPSELPKILADNLKGIDQRLFLRLAEMSDVEEDDYEKLRIRQLATLVASTLETILEQADRQMDEDATAVQGLLRTLALDSGEFELPIGPAQLEACRLAIREQLSELDEGFVGTVKAYMKKASDDGLESMVDVLRVLLQTYAAERLRSLAGGAEIAASGGVQTAMSAALDANPSEWVTVLRVQCTSDDASCSATELVETLQDKMGEVVLSMPAGSAVQSVVAEYLNELLGQARAIAADQE